MTLEEGLEVLHVDAGANDRLIISLLNAVPHYIQTATGMTVEMQATEPLVKVATGFLLRLWYFGDHADDVALKRTIDSLLITLKAKVQTAEADS